MAVDNQNLPKLVPSAHTPNVANVVASSTDQKDQEIFLPTLNTSTTSSPIIYPDNPANNIANDVYNNDDQQYFDSFPPGYRFCPLDGELIVYYLNRKILGQPLPRNQISEVNLYDYNPDEISGMYPSVNGNHWYFFTPRDKKYANGTRPNRAAGTGYWKATGADKDIKFKGNRVGVKKALVFYRGKPPKGVKTDWIMQEYRVDNESSPRIKRRRSTNDMRLDDYVLSKIYKNNDKSFKGRQRNEGANQPVQANELERNGSLFGPPAMPDCYAPSRQPYLPMDPALYLPPPQHISMDIQPSLQSTVPYRFSADIINLNGNFPAQCFQHGGLPGHDPLVDIHSILNSKPLDSNPGGNICDMGAQTNLMEFDYTDHYINWNNPAPPSLESPEDIG